MICTLILTLFKYYLVFLVVSIVLIIFSFADEIIIDKMFPFCTDVF